MTKADLAKGVCDSTEGGCSKREAFDLVESVLGIMKETLGQGESLKLTSFGKFDVSDKAPRMGRNPQTGEPTLIEARRVVKFTPSAKLRGKMNDQHDE